MARASAATMISWLTYFIALQLLEPAVVYTVFSGTVPIVIAGAGWLSVKEASAPAGGGSLIGHLMIALSCVFLCIISLVGLSGFVRGGLIGSCGGLIALLTAGAASAWLVLSCRRLNRFGVKSNAQFGLRYLPYVGVAATAAVLGLDAKGPVQSSTLATAIALGLPLIVLPSYLVQRAVALVSPLTIGVAGALGPFLVFGLQAMQGRVAYSNWSLYGIIAYSLGAVITALSEGIMARRLSRDHRALEQSNTETFRSAYRQTTGSSPPR